MPFWCTTGNKQGEIMSRIIIACALAGILGVPAFGQGVDPLVGSWKLTLEKSTYVGSPPPKSQTLTFAGEGQKFH
jgi:hypothetical protein